MTTAVRRVCAAIVRTDRILMVRHREAARDFWTLPGGHAEPGETLADAARREVAEEVRIDGAEVGPALYERRYAAATSGADVHETCFLVVLPDGAEPALGHDPELAPDAQVLADVAWFALDEVRHDLQVARALPALRPLPGVHYPR